MHPEHEEIGERGYGCVKVVSELTARSLSFPSIRLPEKRESPAFFDGNREWWTINGTPGIFDGNIYETWGWKMVEQVWEII